MHVTKNEKIRQAQLSLYNEDYATVEALLRPLWLDFPDYEVFNLLSQAYTKQEKWSELEKLIQRFGETAEGEDVLLDAQLSLFLAKTDFQNAWLIAKKIIEENPRIDENMLEIGYGFRSAGFAEEFLAQLPKVYVSGFDPDLAIANYFAQVNGDYKKAIAHLKNLLSKQPDHAHTQRRMDACSAFISQYTRNLLDGDRSISGDRVAFFKEVLELKPNAITAQEYYLLALACKIFPPFTLLFTLGTFPFSMRAVFYAVFFASCNLVYKGDVRIGSSIQMQYILWFLTAWVLLRLVVMPLFVQVLALWYVPGYHLLKRPFEIIKGLIILIAWAVGFYAAFSPNALNFDYLVAAGLFTHVFLFDYVDVEKNMSPLRQNLIRLYGVFAFVLALLSWLSIISDFFYMFIFISWLPLITMVSVWDFLQKHLIFSPESNEILEKTNPKLTWLVRVISSISGFIGFVLFILSNKWLKMSNNWLFYASFGVFFTSITLFTLAESKQQGPDFGWLWQYKPMYRFWVILLCMAMIAGVLSLSPIGNKPIRQSLEWLPGVLLFFSAWAGLFLVDYWFKKKHA